MDKENGPRADGGPNLSALLRELRHKALLTQEELADRSGVSVGTIASLENGRTQRPRPGSLRLLADALELTDELRTRLITATPARRAPATPNPADAMEYDGVVPTQLPGALGVFAGRTDELKRLDELLDPPSPSTTLVATISGMPGVGKTTLAVHWARQIADDFPDGQLYLNLRGFDRTGDPMTAGEAVWHLLGALTEMPAELPDNFQALQGRYRGLLHGRRVLIVLDNARDADQVRPLLPGGPGCLVLVTSRNQLTGLVATDGAVPMELDVLSESEACDLLTARLGRQRIAAERAAVEDIIDRCARLPLALAVLAARAAIYPAFPLSVLAAALRDARGALDLLDGGDPATDARAVFSWSYETLSPDAARLFRFLGVHCGPEFTASAAASVIGLFVPAAKALLGELTRAHLATEPTPGRYAIHDLLGAFAAELAAAVDGEPTARFAAHRLLDHYLHSAHAAERLLVRQFLNPIDPVPAQPAVTFECFTEPGQALAWFTAELGALVAAVERAAALGFHVHAWQLAWGLKTFLDWRGHGPAWLHTQQIALAATIELGDRPAQARVHRILAIATFRWGDRDQAWVHSVSAMAMFTDLGDTAGRGRTHLDRAAFYARLGAYRDAVRHALAAYELFQLVDDRPSMPRALNAAGWYHAQLGEYEPTLARCEQALELLRELPEHPDRAHILDSIAYAHHQRGDLDTAIGYYHQAVAGLEPLIDQYVKAEILIRLGDAYQAAGRPHLAADEWRTCLTILEDIRDPRAAEVRARLADAQAS